MQIEKMKIDEVIPYENNAKIHTSEQIEQIKKSIKEFGNNDPIAIDENNVVIEGHGRLIALKELGYDEVEVIKLKHMTEEQKKAYMLVHNKLTMNTDFDYGILNMELEDIVNIDMAEFDFVSQEEIDWASVEDLNESSYEKPEKDMLECPNCHHIDTKTHFKKVDGLEVAEELAEEE